MPHSSVKLPATGNNQAIGPRVFTQLRGQAMASPTNKIPLIEYIPAEARIPQQMLAEAPAGYELAAFFFTISAHA